MLDYQTARELITGLEAFRGHDPEEYHHLIEPLTKFVFNNSFYKLPDVNELAKAIVTVKAETTAVDEEPSITAQLVASQIKPWIEDIRQKLFHSKSAPFASLEDAEIWWNEAEKKTDEWLKRVDEWRGKTDEWLKRRDEWHTRWQAMLKKYPLIKEGIGTWAALHKEGIPVELPTEEERQQLDEINQHVESLDAGEPPEQDEQIKIYEALLDDILEIVKVTGFRFKSVKMCILADASPVLPNFTFGIIREAHQLPSGISILNRYARVTVRGDLTFEDLRSLYRNIRRELGIKRSKGPTKKHLQLYEMVKRRGSIPHKKGTVTFWRSVMKEWNNLHRQDKYKTWKGVKLAYDRIIAQLERRIATKEIPNERPHNKEG